MAKTHQVKQGDTMVSIALRYGFRDWRAIWSHPDNWKIRAARPDPQILYEGDEVIVPDKDVQKTACGTGSTHRFVLKAAPVFVRLHLKDEEGQPVADHRFLLEVGGRSIEGRSGPDGLIHEEVPPESHEGKLTLWLREDGAPFTWKVKIGHLDPADTISGVQARLNHLGYHPGEVTGEMNEQTAAALRRFQERLGYKVPTGDLDERTRRGLREMHEPLPV